MHTYKTYNNIAKEGIDQLENYGFKENKSNPDALLMRNSLSAALYFSSKFLASWYESSGKKCTLDIFNLNLFEIGNEMMFWVFDLEYRYHDYISESVNYHTYRF